MNSNITNSNAQIFAGRRNNALVRARYENLTADDKLALLGRAIQGGAVAWAAKRAGVAVKGYVMSAQDIKDAMRLWYNYELANLRYDIATALLAEAFAIVWQERARTRIANAQEAAKVANMRNRLTKPVIKTIWQQIASFVGA